MDHQIAEHAQEVFDTLKKYRFLQFIPCMDPIGSSANNMLTPEEYAHFLSVLFQNYKYAMIHGNNISIRTFDNWILMLGGFMPESCGSLGSCSANYLIESNGNVYPCDFYALDEWLLGNINDHSFYKLSRSRLMSKFVQESFPVAKECIECRFYSICRGGCKRESIDFSQSGRRKSRLCTAYRTFFEQHETDMRILSQYVLQRYSR